MTSEVLKLLMLKAMRLSSACFVACFPFSYLASFARIPQFSFMFRFCGVSFLPLQGGASAQQQRGESRVFRRANLRYGGASRNRAMGALGPATETGGVRGHEGPPHRSTTTGTGTAAAAGFWQEQPWKS